MSLVLVCDRFLKMGSKRQRSCFDGSVDCCGCGRTFVPTGDEEECPRCTQSKRVRLTSNSDCTYGSLRWYMKQFNELTRECKVNSSRSQAFLTSQYGYNLCVQLDVFYNVLKNTREFFLRPVILKGPKDAIKAWPFKEKIIFKIINQIDHQAEKVLTYQPDPNSSCFKKPTSEMNVASAGIALPDVNQLYNQGFVKDGTLIIICECQTSDLPAQIQDAFPLSCDICEPSE